MIKRSVRCLKKEILKSDIYKEYHNLKMQIESSLEINELKKEINKLKQNMTNSINSADLHSFYKKEYLEKTKILESNPLIQNFKYVEEEFINELNLIKEQINS